MTQLTFRPIDIGSVDDLVTVFCNRLDTADQNGGNAQPDKGMAAYLKDRHSKNPAYLTFALDGDNIVGQLELTDGKAPDVGYINLVYVTESRRGQGLGAQLLRWTENLFVKSGFSYARLTSWEANTGNTEFYTRQGWTCLGPRRDIQSGFLTWEKALVR